MSDMSLFERVESEKSIYDNAYEAAIDHVNMAHSHLFEEFEGRDIDYIITDLNSISKKINEMIYNHKHDFYIYNPCGEIYTDIK